MLFNSINIETTRNMYIRFLGKYTNQEGHVVFIKSLVTDKCMYIYWRALPGLMKP